MDKKEFKVIYHEYYRLVSAIACSMLRDYHLAQDVTQEVFVNLYRNFSTIDQKRVKGWLITCTSRRAIDYKRKTYYQREVTGDMEPCEWEGTISAEQEIFLKEIYGEILAELYQRNRRWFELIIRLDIEGECSDLVAKKLGMTKNCLHVNHYRARQWMNQRYEKEKNCGDCF